MKLEKVTKERGPARPGRRYHDACGAAHGLDLIGERWALLVVRELMFGPRRFGDLKSDLYGVSANVLTQRLEGLEASGVVRRRKLPPPASVQVYELSDWGYESLPVFEVLGRWAARSPRHDPTQPISAISTIMSLRTMFDAAAAGDLDIAVGFRFGDQTFRTTIRDGALNSERGDVSGCDLVFTGAQAVIPEFVFAKRPLADLVREGRLSLDGDPALAQRFQSLFALPNTAPEAEAIARAT